MVFKVILAVFLGIICSCSANPVPASLVPKNATIYLPGDDKTNWEDMYKAIKNDVARSSGNSTDIFDEIVTINARERGSGVARADSSVFLFEGDIEMNRTDAVNLIQGQASQGTSRGKRAVMKNTGRNLWPKNIPYAIDGSLNYVKANIKRAIKEWENALPCMGTWRDVTNSRRPGNYMYFFRGSGCYSQVGRVGGAQRVSIGNGCQQHGVVVHEIGHAMGLWHEQSRPDRDNYVQIMWNNIIPAMKFNFQKHSSSRINSFGVPYDYSSVMHYGAYAFSRYRGLRTIQSKPAGKSLGQRSGLSSYDKKQVQHLYGCTTSPKPKPTTKPQPPSGCTDVQSKPNCDYWKNKGYCRHTFVDYMKKNCCKTCRTRTCTKVDNHRNCSSWAKAKYCNNSRYMTYMQRNCAKSCQCS